ncbi:tRNA-binding protein [Candidatus Pacearchaeota archaeon]|nr:tRNA-binding protein [Candidatus Pacearchaeota archaeon]
MTATFEDFQKLNVRVGKIIKVEDFPEARKPAYKLTIDLGKDIGIKMSSVQIVKNYKKDDLKNKLVLCVVNLSPRRIGHFTSEVLTLGIPDKNNECILIKPDKDVPVGGKLY